MSILERCFCRNVSISGMLPYGKGNLNLGHGYRTEFDAFHNVWD